MDHELNQFQQPVGLPVENWTPPPWPTHRAMPGLYCTLEPLEPCIHGDALYRANTAQPDDASWTYMPYGPFAARADYQTWLEQYAHKNDPQFYAIVDNASQQASGVASWLRITPTSGTIEVGHLHFSPQLRRSRAATEAMALMMKQAFALGYRRYEWKCNALNASSRRAAERLGFTFEGIFRQATVVKGRNRDTAWYSITDQEWPTIQAELDRWLSPENFDPQGQQKSKLSCTTLSDRAIC